MADSFIGVPYPYTVVNATDSGGDSIKYLANDEPGLTWLPTAARTGFDIVLDLGYARKVDFICILGISVPDYGTVAVFADNTTNFSPPQYNNNVQALSFAQVAGDRTPATAKCLILLPSTAPACRYWLVRLAFPAAVRPSAWRLLIGKKIQPVEGVSIGASEGVDDRSSRRYARNGRRVIDPTVIVPTFDGEWPWLEDAEYTAMRRWWRQYGATTPSLFVLDPDPASKYGGEDGILYGDFEKSSKFTYGDGCYSFSFALAAISD